MSNLNPSQKTVSLPKDLHQSRTALTCGKPLIGTIPLVNTALRPHRQSRNGVHSKPKTPPFPSPDFSLCQSRAGLRNQTSLRSAKRHPEVRTKTSTNGHLDNLHLANRNYATRHNPDLLGSSKSCHYQVKW